MLMQKLHRKAAYTLSVVTAAAAVIFTAAAATLYFDVAPGDWYYTETGRHGASDILGDFYSAQSNTYSLSPFEYVNKHNLLFFTGWTGKVQLDFPLSAVDAVTEELVISLNRRMLQENAPKVIAELGESVDGIEKHLTNYGRSIYDCYQITTILPNSKNNVPAGVALSGKQEYYGYSLQVFDILTQDSWHQMAEATGKDPWQCTWWAWGRAAQYIKLAYGQSLVDLCDGVTLLGNGGDYYHTMSPYFQGSATVPKPNSIVSWSGGQYGHVGYVEAVDDGGIWVSMADAGHAWRGITYIPKSHDPDNLYPLHWYGESERCNGFIYLDSPK